MKRLKKKKLLFAFVDLEKPFDWVPREVIYFALRQKVDGDMSLNKDCCFSWRETIKFIFCEGWKVYPCGVGGERVGRNSI